MKRFLKKAGAALLILTMVTAAAACGKGENGGNGGDSANEVDLDSTCSYTPDSAQASVKGHLTERPSYALEEGADVEKQREMVIRAMLDLLTFKWTPSVKFTYQKSGAAAGKDFEFYPQLVYAGVPYSNAALGLFHALETYDFNTGVMYGVADMADPNREFGNSCAACVNWAESAVCPGMLAVNTFEVTPSFGYVTVGYDFPAGSQKYNGTCTTEIIVQQIGNEVMYESLAQALPADALITQGSSVCGDHCMMVYTAPKVVHGADGKIDPEKSTLTIIDQWSKDYPLELDGEQVSIRGRLDKEFSFKYLTDNHFILMRPAEFANNTPYTKATAVMKNGSTNLAELKKDRVITNFRTVKIESAIVSEAGNTVYVKKNLTDRTLYNGRMDRALEGKTIIPGKDALEVMKDGKTYTLKVRALLATGDYITVTEFPVTTQDIK